MVDREQCLIASDGRHVYIPPDPDIDQTSPDPLHLQCRSLGIGTRFRDSLFVSKRKLSELEGTVHHAGLYCHLLYPYSSWQRYNQAIVVQKYSVRNSQGRVKTRQSCKPESINREPSTILSSPLSHPNSRNTESKHGYKVVD